ncbi:hypothetical protein BC629DRAFT_1442895 [Irpex lacteus]|nr:hypothetical protein BC629DRAFT_1442895 [Irpex lacteus]
MSSNATTTTTDSTLESAIGGFMTVWGVMPHPVTYSTASSKYHILTRAEFCVYEHLTTFNMEIERIWKRSDAPVRGQSNRYVCLCYTAFSLVDLGRSGGGMLMLTRQTKCCVQTLSLSPMLCGVSGESKIYAGLSCTRFRCRTLTFISESMLQRKILLLSVFAPPTGTAIGKCLYRFLSGRSIRLGLWRVLDIQDNYLSVMSVYGAVREYTGCYVGIKATKSQELGRMIFSYLYDLRTEAAAVSVKLSSKLITSQTRQTHSILISRFILGLRQGGEEQVMTTSSFGYRNFQYRLCGCSDLVMWKTLRSVTADVDV